jgi:hypothetical protein
MFEGPVIIWAASRAPSDAESKVLSQTAFSFGAEVRTIAMSALGPEIVSSIVRGAVVVIVDSRRDAAAALSFGADETVRLAPPTSTTAALRKRALRGALDRAIGRSTARTRRVAAPEAVGDYPGLTLLMRVVERQLGSPLNEAALNCNRLADELAHAVAVADGLMQRVRLGSSRDELREWSREVKQYAQATLRAETLVSELRGQVERGDAVMRLLGDSPGGGPTRTDTESLLQQLAELLRVDLGDDISLDVATAGPCFVEMARPALLCIVCAAIEIALENVRAMKSPARLELRASRTDTEVLIEVADNGAPGVTDLRPSLVDSLLADPRTAKLRRLRDRVRSVDGELTVDTVDACTVVSIYLPISAELTPADSLPVAPKVQVERRNH